jgi:hypothetical protein
VNKRHAKPSTAVLLRRVDRKLNGLEKAVTDQLALGRLDIQSLRAVMVAHCAVLATHCERLVREKEAREKSSGTG